MASQQPKRLRIIRDVQDLINNEHFGDISDIEDLSDEEDNFTASEDVALIAIGAEEEISFQVMDEVETDCEDEQLPPVSLRKRASKKKCTWHKTDNLLEVPLESVFDMPPRNPMNPYQYFLKFVPNSLIDDISEKTNIYHLQMKGKLLNTNSHEIQKLVGMHIEMGTMKFPNIRLYWASKRRYPLIAEAMTFNRFVTLRNNLHCVDNARHDEQDTDKFWKVRPILDAFNKVLLENPPLRPKGLFKKMPRGTMEGCSTTDGRMCLVTWNDNSIVTMISSAYDWKEPPGKVLRWNKEQQAKIEVDCPSPVIQYNKSMGGVDKLDFLMSLYRIHLKSRKWTLRVIFHFIDLAVVTSWLQYKKDCVSYGIPLKDQMPLLEFRLEISECLIKCGSIPLLLPSPGRPRVVAQHRPPNDVRFDGLGHFPIYDKKRLRCKYANCGLTHFSNIYCEKCEVALCLNKNNNCFRDYHKP